VIFFMLLEHAVNDRARGCKKLEFCLAMARWKWIIRAPRKRHFARCSRGLHHNFGAPDQGC